MITRRDAIAGGLTCGAGLALAGEAAGVAPTIPRPPVPDLGFLRTFPLLHEERARRFMAEERLDALVVTRPANVFYLTNHWPQLDRMGFTDSAIAILPRDPARPVALVMGAFSYYYVHSDEGAFDNRLVFTYTTPADGKAADGPADPEPAAIPARTFRVVDEAMLTERERRRRAALAGARGNSPTEAWALARALRELRLDTARLGTDEPHLEALMRARGLAATCVPAEDTVRRIRLVKSPTEIRLMRIAAQNNVEAAMAAARQARALGSTRALRDAFFVEAAKRGNVGVFMVIDGSSSEIMDAPLKDGMAVLFDCVSTCRYYHGDFSRTIFVGEPVARMKRVTDAIATAWHDVREQLRPGLRFADIPRLGNESLRRQGMDLFVSFTPHSVGLFHTDHPRPSMTENRTVEGLVVEEGMILSVDCPVLDTGIGGTAHIEDLMLIGAQGAEPLHEVPPGVVVV